MGLSSGVQRFGFGLSAIFLFIATLSVAQTPQQIIAGAEWFERDVAPGVTWRHHHFDDLFNSEQDIFITDVDLNDPGVTIRFPHETGGATRTVSSFAGITPDAAVVINGNFGDSGGSVQFFRANGSLINPTKDPSIADEGAIVIDGSENLSLMMRPGPGWASLTEPHVMASNTMAVNGGAEWPLWSGPFYFTDRHPRTIVGHTADNHLLMVVVDGRSPTAEGMTYSELATTMISLGAVNALGLDGGGSSTMWVRGEPGNGVVNTPSDGGQRLVANAVAVITSGAIAPQALDARLVGVSSYDNTMLSGETQTVWMEFENYGTTTWTSGTQLVATEARDRGSEFFTSGDWTSSSVVTAMDQVSVAPGQTGRFTFTITAPSVSTPTNFTESFGLTDGGTQPFGPEQSRFNLTVLPEGGLTGTIIIESRGGGQNNGWYVETGGWADNGSNCTATGMTPGIGQRYGSTYRSVAGLKSATFTPLITQAGEYNVFVTWGAAGNRRSPITYRVHHSGGVDEYSVDQTANANTWYPLGTHTLSAGTGGYVEVSNENIDVSGSMYTAAAIFEPVAPTASTVVAWNLFR